MRESLRKTIRMVKRSVLLDHDGPYHIPWKLSSLFHVDSFYTRVIRPPNNRLSILALDDSDGKIF